ncbi:MAG: rhodanese-like domain-containing protein [Verrucomicrobiaceae bacterium]|nr:MAG: rhodanese-like domain-containing protein [Verrucomicrobiaceae bacterium]
MDIVNIIAVLFIVQTTPETITTSELRTRLDGNFQGLLIDVREPDEHAISSIPGARLIPLGTLQDHLSELPKDREILVHCKAGGRSARAVTLLLANGFTNVKNVGGGIDAWLGEG